MILGFLIWLLAWAISCLIAWRFCWDDSDRELIDVLIFFTPINVPMLSVIGLWNLVYWLIKTIKKKIKKVKMKIAWRKMKDVDPYGEEDWTT